MDTEPLSGQATLERKVVGALERLSQALRLLLWDAVNEHGLSPIQGQILIYIHDHREELCRVGHLAREFGVTPATVSDSVSALEAKALVRREPWSGDGRMVTLRLTEAGIVLVRALASWAELLRESVADFPIEEQERSLLFLMRLIEGLQRRGVITVARMCITCRFFRPDAHPEGYAPHHCALLDKPLAISTLRVDCPEHDPIPS